MLLICPLRGGRSRRRWFFLASPLRSDFDHHEAYLLIINYLGTMMAHKLQIRRLAFLFLISLLTTALYAQVGERYVCLTLESGVVRCGYLTLDDGREITLETPDMGTLIVPKVNVIQIVDAPEGTQGGGSGTDIELSDRMTNGNRALQATRYFFAPSAHSLRAGEGYGSLCILGIGNVSYGLSDNAIGGLSASLLGAGVTVKASTQLSETVHASAGGLAQIGWSGGRIVFPFVNVTKGDENNHFTIAAGYLGGTTDDSNNADEIDSPMLNISGCVQVADHAWFMTENYYFFKPEFFPVNMVGSMGLRLWRPNKQRLQEYAFMMLIEEDMNVIPVPWISYTWPF